MSSPAWGEVARLFLDKWETAKLAERLGVPAPLTFIPECYADLQRRRDQLAFPCVVKPRDGHLFYRVFARKMDRVESYDELVTAWAAADDAGLRVMVQEFVPGPDSHGVNYNAYVHDGRVLRRAPRNDCVRRRRRSAAHAWWSAASSRRSPSRPHVCSRGWATRASRTSSSRRTCATASTS